MANSKNKLQYIEGIRGLAAVMVVLHHFTLIFYPALNYGELNQIHLGNGSLEMFIAKSPFNLIYNGGFAVSVFFILSGFVLSNVYHQSLNPVVLYHYTLKRYFRLVIPVSLTVIISYFFIKVGFMNHFGLGELTKNAVWLYESFKQTLGIPGTIKNMFVDVFFLKDNTYNPVLWTMTYEFLGSLLLFSFLLVIHGLRYKIILYAGLILGLIATKNNFYAAFILGAFLNRMLYDIKFMPGTVLKHKITKVLIGLIGLFFCSYPLLNRVDNTIYACISFSQVDSYDFYHVIGSFMLMYVIVQSDKVKKALSNTALVFIGKISFSFYLLHFIIFCSFTCYLFKLLYATIGYNVAALLSFAISLPVIILVSIVYYQWIDKTGIKFSEKILRLFVSKNEL